LLDRRQSLLDPVGEHGAREGPELAEVAPGPFPAGKRDQQRRFVRRVAHTPPTLGAPNLSHGEPAAHVAVSR
jgi:hypothetical protein